MRGRFVLPVRDSYRQGRSLRNARQLIVMSEEEIAYIGSAIGVPDLDPALLGATIVVSGLPDLSHLPPSSRLIVEGREVAAGVVVDMESRPCTLISRAIDSAHPGAGRAVKPAAQGRRGVVGWVEAEGSLRIGDVLRLSLPDQPPWKARG